MVVNKPIGNDHDHEGKANKAPLYLQFFMVLY